MQVLHHDDKSRDECINGVYAAVHILSIECVQTCISSEQGNDGL